MSKSNYNLQDKTETKKKIETIVLDSDSDGNNSDYKSNHLAKKLKTNNLIKENNFIKKSHYLHKFISSVT